MSRGNTKDIRRQRARNNAKKQQIIPTWALLVTPVMFIFMGYASEHYRKSRGLDPLLRRPMFRIAARLASRSKRSHEHMRRSLLTAQEDDELETYDGKTLHLIFSTDCSPYQHWQSYLVYYTAMKVKQPGHVTRIVSGCEDEEAGHMKTWFDDNISHMSKRFHLHFTPHFSQVVDEAGKIVGDYKFFNKPFGLRHWLQNFELLGFNNGKFSNQDDIVILTDPDMALTRPITGDFSDMEETVIGKSRQGDKMLGTEVTPGIPFAQTYGLGVQWQKFDLDKIAGPDSPAKEVSKADGNLYYPVGPPYLGTLGDMYKIANKWSEFVPRVHAQYPHLLAEMYAYCIAAAHLKLPHQLIDSLMISNPGNGGEGWPLVDIIPPSETCSFAQGPDHTKYSLPSVIHLCQRYSIGEEWFFGKRKIPTDIYECETPLFEEPPGNVATLYDFKKPPNAKARTQLSPKVANQQAFMVCFLTSLLNEAATFYKKSACSVESVNFQRSRTVADLFKA